MSPDDIYGEGVNIAARLEGLANPGDVYISGGIYEQIKHKLVCGYQSLGDRRVKNITDPISVYRVLPDPAAVVQARHMRRLAAILALGITAIAIVGAMGWYFFTRQPMQLAIQVEHCPGTDTQRNQLDLSRRTADGTAHCAGDEVVIGYSSRRAASGTTVPPPPLRPELVVEPEMVSLTGGTFVMGSNDDPSEMPVRHVTLNPSRSANSRSRFATGTCALLRRHVAMSRPARTMRRSRM